MIIENINAKLDFQKIVLIKLENLYLIIQKIIKLFVTKK